MPTKPREAERRYTAGGNGWYRSVVRASFNQVAIDEQYFELLRLWLLGSWVDHEKRVPFLLINLVRCQREQGIEKAFGKLLKTSPDHDFRRATWEGALDHLRVAAPNHAVTMRTIYNKKRLATIVSGEYRRPFVLELPRVERDIERVTIPPRALPSAARAITLRFRPLHANAGRIFIEARTESEQTPCARNHGLTEQASVQVRL